MLTPFRQRLTTMLLGRAVPTFKVAAAIIMVLAFTLAGCASRSRPPTPKPGAPKPYKVLGRWYQPLADSKGFAQKGLASWYGKKFHGRKTSNGERYDMYGISAAHKTLPLGTWVRVRNLENGKTLDVRINDRGPFVRGRIIDLSYGAARKIGIVGPGTAKVKVVALGRAGKPSTTGQRTYQAVDYQRGKFTFQVGAFTSRQNAEAFVRKLDAIYINAHMITGQEGENTFYRVRVGRCDTLTQASAYENYLVNNGFPDAFTVAE